MKTVNLYELEQHFHTVVLVPDGPKYRVRPVSARVANLIAAAEQETDGVKKLQLYYDAVAIIVPTMPRDDVDNLTPSQIGEILALARAGVDAVEEAANPNAESPAPIQTPGTATTTTSAASS